MARDRYTRYPRPILWLIPESEDGAVAPFYLSKVPVTNEQYEAFDPGHLRAEVSPGDADPAVGVSLEDAREYCRWYAEVSRKPMRLPTEAEWEHACRGGAEGRYFWGDDPAEADRYLWDAANSEGRVPPLDGTLANGFGLFAMLGGVWEWVEGAGENAADEPGLLRGGSFRTPRKDASCRLRRPAPASLQADDVGFRIAKNLR